VENNKDNGIVDLEEEFGQSKTEEFIIQFEILIRNDYTFLAEMLNSYFRLGHTVQPAALYSCCSYDIVQPPSKKVNIDYSEVAYW
jgi:hypothetical protein